MKIENFEAFKIKFDEVVRNLITEEMLIPVIEIDQELQLDDITTSSYKILRQFAPFGPGNMRPVFLSSKCIDTNGSRIVGEDRTHLKLEVKQQDGVQTMQGIGFKLGKNINWLKAKTPVDLVYTLEENEWRDKVSLQLQVQDMKLHQEPVIATKASLEENPT